jgi:hypothetical protein
MMAQVWLMYDAPIIASFLKLGHDNVIDDGDNRKSLSVPDMQSKVTFKGGMGV